MYGACSSLFRDGTAQKFVELILLITAHCTWKVSCPFYKVFWHTCGIFDGLLDGLLNGFFDGILNGFFDGLLNVFFRQHFEWPFRRPFEWLFRRHFAPFRRPFERHFRRHFERPFRRSFEWPFSYGILNGLFVGLSKCEIITYSDLIMVRKHFPSQQYSSFIKYLAICMEHVLVYSETARRKSLWN